MWVRYITGLLGICLALALFVVTWSKGLTYSEKMDINAILAILLALIVVVHCIYAIGHSLAMNICMCGIAMGITIGLCFLIAADTADPAQMKVFVSFITIMVLLESVLFSSGVLDAYSFYDDADNPIIQNRAKRAMKQQRGKAP